MCYLCELQWDRYLLCDGSPDPTIPGEINTYINLWRENTTDRSVDIILNESLLILRVSEIMMLFTSEVDNHCDVTVRMFLVLIF